MFCKITQLELTYVGSYNHGMISKSYRIRNGSSAGSGLYFVTNSLFDQNVLWVSQPVQLYGRSCFSIFCPQNKKFFISYRSFHNPEHRYASAPSVLNLKNTFLNTLYSNLLDGKLKHLEVSINCCFDQVPRDRPSCFSRTRHVKNMKCEMRN